MKVEIQGLKCERRGCQKEGFELSEEDPIFLRVSEVTADIDLP